MDNIFWEITNKSLNLLSRTQSGTSSEFMMCEEKKKKHQNICPTVGFEYNFFLFYLLFVLHSIVLFHLNIFSFRFLAIRRLGAEAIHKNNKNNYLL